MKVEQNFHCILDAVLASLKEGIIVLDTESRVVMYNQAAANIFRIHNTNQSFRLVDMTRNKIVHKGFQQVLDTGTPFNSNVEFFNDQDYIFSFRAVPLFTTNNKVIDGAIGIFFDITQLMSLEQIRREFFSNLSHELRTPLTSILVYAETLLDGAINDKQNNTKFLEIINKHAKRMKNLVNDISDLSSIEAGEINLNFTEIELKNFIDNLIPLISSDLETQNVKFSNMVASGTTVYADNKSLEQIMMNLIINGIKFNNSNGKVTVDACSDEQGYTIISVQDTGIGIETHHLPRIFERLYRVDQSRSQEVDGTGLGLAIVKHLTIANHGEVFVESYPNKGSIFKIKLPQTPQ